jgi:hypothetical protein
MMPLEEKIEDCVWVIDNILENTLDAHDFKECQHSENSQIESLVAHYLFEKGYREDVYKDEVSGPQLNNTSEKALMKIAQDGIIYHGKFQIVSESKKGATYFKVTDVKKIIGREVKYKDIRKNIIDQPEDIFHIDSDTLKRPEYQN